MHFRLLALGVLVFSVSVASAQLYSQLPLPDAEGGAYSDNNQTIADNFTTSASAPVNHITFWGSFDTQGNPFPSGGSRQVSASFYDDAAGSVGTLLQQENLTATFVASGLFTAQQDTIYQFDMDWAGPTFFTPTAGTQYWFSVYDTESINSFRWHNGATGSGVSNFSSDGRTTWNADDGRPDYAFVLNPGAVPEPASMVALGLGAAALLRRRKA